MRATWSVKVAGGRGGLFGVGDVGEVEGVGDEVGDAALDLEAAADAEEAGGLADERVPLEDLAPDDDVHEAGLVLQVKKVTPLAVPGRWRQMTRPT